MKGKMIYIDNIPSFEEYDLVDLNTYNTLFLMKMYNEEHSDKISKGIRIPDRMFIIGKGMQPNNDSNRTINAKTFYEDYLKLGKKLFELSTSKYNIEFEYSYQLDDDDLYLKHLVFNTEYETMMREKYENYIDEIYTIREEAGVYLSYTIFEEKYSIFFDLTDKILNMIYILYSVFNQDVEEYLKKLETTMSEIFEYCIQIDIDKSKDIFNGLENINNKLLILLKNIRNGMRNNNFDIRKKTITSSRKKTDNITNIDFYNKMNQYPITVKFTYSQFKELKRIIKTWLKKYGFPYYVNQEDVKKYEIEINKILKLKEDEMAVPCDILIIHSVYNYMLYMLFTDKNKTDDKIKRLFNFNSDSKSKNKSNVFSIRNNFNYYNNIVCTYILLNFKSSYVYNEVYDEKELRKDNYLCDYIEKKGCYEDRTFNNLCIAFGLMLKDEILYETPVSDEKRCSVCGNWFIPNREFKVYCSKECQEPGNTRENTKNKRKNRNIKKSNK